MQDIIHLYLHIFISILIPCFSQLKIINAFYKSKLSHYTKSYNNITKATAAGNNLKQQHEEQE